MSASPARVPFGALLVALSIVCGCTSSGRAETRALSTAVDHWRRADGPSKDASGRAIAAVGCTDRQVCDAKQACVAAVDPTIRALSLKDEVTARLADIEAARLAPDSAEARALPAKLDEAERLLKQGRAAMEDCDARLAALQLAFGG